jgi:GH24 family phage-related lysozyme (muramidase)
MRIGDTIQAGLNQYDPSPYLQASSDATRSIGNSISQGIGAVGDAIKDRKLKKDTIKTSKELAKAMAVLYPESAGALMPVIEQLDNEETPLGERAALGSQIGEFINLGVQKSRDESMLKIQNRQLDIQNRGMVIDEDRSKLDIETIKGELDAKKQSEADSKQATAFVAPELLKQVLQQTAAMEQAGGQVGISSERLQEALNAANPQQQMSIAQAALSMMPKEIEEAINFNTPVTINGQPAEAATRFNRRTGQLEIIPISGGTAWGDGSGGSTVENVGLVEMVKQFEGFNPAAYNDFKQTSIGYGTRAKPGEKAISKEEAERRLLSELADARKGVDRAVAAAGLSLNPNQIDALTSFNYNTGAVDTLLKGGARSQEEIAQAMLLYNKAGGKTLPGLQKRRATEAQLFATPSTGITAGASKSIPRARTETQQKLDELALQKAEGEAKIAEVAKESNAVKAQSALESLKKIRNHPGRWAATGMSSTLPTLRGTDAYDFEQKLEQAKALAGTIGIEAMRGLGAMSEKEFQAAKDSIAALDKGQKTETVEAELDKLIGLFESKLKAADPAAKEDAARSARESAAARLRALQGK